MKLRNAAKSRQKLGGMRNVCWPSEFHDALWLHARNHPSLSDAWLVTFDARQDTQQPLTSLNKLMMKFDVCIAVQNDATCLWMGCPSQVPTVQTVQTQQVTHGRQNIQVRHLRNLRQPFSLDFFASDGFNKSKDLVHAVGYALMPTGHARLCKPATLWWMSSSHRSRRWILTFLGTSWKLVDLVEVDVRWCEASGSTVMPEQLQQAWLREFHAAKDIGHFPMLHRDQTMHSEILVILCRWVCLAFLLALLLLPASQGFHITRIFLIGRWLVWSFLGAKGTVCDLCRLWIVSPRHSGIFKDLPCSFCSILLPSFFTTQAAPFAYLVAKAPEDRRIELYN